MNILDRIFLVLTAIAAIYTIYKLFTGQRRSRADVYHIISLSVLTISGLLLFIFGWGILGLMGEGIGNKLVAVVASLIPFAWVLGVVIQIHPKLERLYLPLMALGIILITISRFAGLAEFARIVYPVFHGLAGLTIIFLPPAALKKSGLPGTYLLVSVGGLLISTGGMALAFLMAGKQLFFFSAEVVLMILAPLLLFTVLAYGGGLILSRSPK